MQVLEKVIEARVVLWAKRNGWLALKATFKEVGYPDRLFVSPTGVSVWIEFKRPGKKPEPIQLYRMGDLGGRGVNVTWTDNYEDAISFLEAAQLSTERGK